MRREKEKGRRLRTARQGALFALTDWANKRGVNEGVTEIRDIKKGDSATGLRRPRTRATLFYTLYTLTRAREGRGSG